MLKLSKNFINSLILDTEFKKYFISKTVFESSSIENINISFEDTITIYETSNISIFEGKYLKEELREQQNSIDLLNYTLNTLGSELTLKMLKEMHSILKFRTEWSANFTNSYGKFKALPNSIGGIQTSQPYEVPIHLQQLIDSLNENIKILKSKNYSDSTMVKLNLFSQFHIKFEQIHPFLDGNGRIGRILLIKMCLENDLFPPIISSDKLKRSEYYQCLKESDSISLSKLLKTSMLELEKEYETYINNPNSFIKQHFINETNTNDFQLNLDWNDDFEI